MKIRSFTRNKKDIIKRIDKPEVSAPTNHALQKLLSSPADSFFVEYIQASIMLGLVLVSSFLWYLLKSEFALFKLEEINTDIFTVIYTLFGLPFFLLSFSIFFKMFLRIWASILLGCILFILLGAILTEEAFSFGPLLNQSDLSVSILVGFVFFLFGILLWKGLFIVSFIGLGGFIIYTFISLSMANYPQILGAPDIAKNGAPNNVIHVVIDNHINLQYLSLIENKFNDLDVHNFIVDFYKKNNFTLATKAYSSYTNSVKEASNIINFGTFSEENYINKESLNIVNEDNGIDTYMTKNRYFNILKKNKYNIYVYQSYESDFCTYSGDVITRCYSFYPVNSLQDKTQFFEGYLSSFENVPMLSKNSINYDKMPVVDGQKSVFDKALEDIKKLNGENLFFIHLSGLKTPFIYDKNCEINTSLSENKQEHYINQLGCTYKQIDAFVSALRTNGILENNKIIIHGLGGANLSQGAGKDNVVNTRQEALKLMIDLHLTTFAHKNQGQDAFAVDSSPCDVNTLFLRSLGMKNAQCKPVSITDFSVTRLLDFSKYLGLWFNSF